MKLKLPPRPSTRALIREARRTPGYSLFDLIHGYVYARWPYLYIGIGKGDHRLARWVRPLLGRLGRLFPARPRADGRTAGFADTYHGKVMPLAAAARLVTVQQEVRRSLPEPVIPYALARDIVLQHPDHIVALDCPCRAGKENPCLPLDVCLIVGEPFAGFVAEHHPRRSRRISPEEAVEILRREDERGHVHHAFFKDAMLGRFYAICNCCSCCCGAMGAHQHGTPMLAPSGYVSRLDAVRCRGCGACVGHCPFGAISLGEGVARVDEAACMGCGVCEGRCPEGALALVRDARKGEPLSTDF